MIVNERKFYPGYSLDYYLKHGSVDGQIIASDEVQQLRRYAEKCGPFVIHASTPGTVGYLVGPAVSIIDTLGLTDSYIARLPRENLVSPNPRPGHPYKLIPLSYLVSRGDLAILPQFGAGIAVGDCTLTSQVKNIHGDRLIFPR
jgi:hypothetical protein